MIDFDLRDTLQEVLETGRHEGASRGVALTARLDPEVPTALSGDAHHLRLALQLLLGHALASTHTPRVELEVAADVLSDEEAVLHFEVRDSAPALIPAGGGVPAFATLTPDADPNLALWTHIAKQIAEELGVRSDPGSGNVYWFRVGVLLRQELLPQEIQR